MTAQRGRLVNGRKWSLRHRGRVGGAGPRRGCWEAIRRHGRLRLSAARSITTEGSASSMRPPISALTRPV